MHLRAPKITKISAWEHASRHPYGKQLQDNHVPNDIAQMEKVMYSPDIEVSAFQAALE